MKKRSRPKSPTTKLPKLNVERAAQALRAALLSQASAARARGAKLYLKSELQFLGVSVPAIRREARAFQRTHPELDRRTLARLTKQLWATGVHELRSLAIAILERYVQHLRADDVSLLLKFASSADTWAHIDWLAIKVLGPIVAREPALSERLIACGKDSNFWVRRSALLALHDPLLAGRGDFALFERLAVPLLPEREFFIRKAIGWVLRATARRTPERTIGFVERYAGQMSTVTFREATRALPAPVQRRLLALRNAAS